MRTLLVLDDDPSIVTLMEHALRNAGYRVLMAANGVEGLRLLKSMEAPPDLILADIMMPEIDGLMFNMLVRLMPEFRLVPFVFLTALASEDDMLKAYMAGFDDYITKPFTVRDLLLRVSTQIEKMEPYRKICATRDGSMEGSLKDIPITRLFSFFSLTGRSGTISFRHAEGQGQARFVGGYLSSIAFAGLEGNDAISRLYHLGDVPFTLECQG
jgi:CheY-like chemotaxis protein